MALSATTIFEVRTAGSDTANGGGFDPGQTAGMFTDGAATVATGNSPVFTSASYNFVAGDVGAWLYIASGANWTKGWYQIASVAANAATLTASIGNAILSVSSRPAGASTAAGCATTASPTGATWSIDYSQQNAAQFSYTDLTGAGAGSAVSSAAKPFGKQQVGNALIIASGTNFTAGVYIIASLTGAVANLIGAAATMTGAGSADGVGGQGGAFISPGKAGLIHVSGNLIYVKTGTYSITSASVNVAAGCPSLTAGTATTSTRLIGYGTLRGDNLTPPTLQAGNAITTFTIVTLAAQSHAINVIADGASLTSSRGFTGTSTSFGYKCQGKNCKNSAFFAGVLVLCEATGCATVAAFTGFATCVACSAHDNTFTGFADAGCIYCVAANNTGASSDGFAPASTNQTFGCTAYTNGRHGFNGTSVGARLYTFPNCISYGNVGSGFTDAGGVQDSVFLTNCAGGSNGSGNVGGNISGALNFGFITLTGDPFTNAAGNDFSLDNTTNEGAACRAAGIPGALAANQLPGLSTLAYLDIGAAQHADPASTAGTFKKSPAGRRVFG